MPKSLGNALVAAIAGFLPTIGAAAAPGPDTIIYHFTSAEVGPSGNNVISGLTKGPGGVLYGTTLYGGANDAGMVFRLTPPAKAKPDWSFSILRNMAGNPGPAAGLAINAAGALFGTDSASGPDGDGSVYKLTAPASGKGVWNETVLHNFSGGDDGYNVLAPVILDPSGAVYGTTAQGGPNEGLVGYGGIVFKLSPPTKTKPGWTKSLLYAFGGGADGGYPAGGLLRAPNGVLYGTTFYAGADGDGVVFKLTPPVPGISGWTETVLHSFSGGADGSGPVASLVFDSAGALYGTTQYGGSTANGGFGFGTVFKLAPPTKAKPEWTYSVLHRFTGGADGAEPLSSLLVDGKTLIGTTSTGGVLGNGGNADGGGVVFKLTPPTAGKVAWTETVLHDFAVPPSTTDGANPAGGVIPDGSGGFYGTTSNLAGGVNEGTVFRLP